MTPPDRLLPWASGLAIAGAAAIVVVGLSGAAVLYGLATLPWLQQFYAAQVDPYAGPITPGVAALAGLVALWTILVGGLALWAGVALRRPMGHEIRWGVIALVAAFLSLPLTGGLGVGALLLAAGGVLGILASTAEPGVKARAV